MSRPPSGGWQWDPHQRRWYWAEGAGPPPPMGNPAAPRSAYPPPPQRGAHGEPPGYRQGFNAQPPGYVDPPTDRYHGRHGQHDGERSSVGAPAGSRGQRDARGQHQTRDGGPSDSSRPGNGRGHGHKGHASWTPPAPPTATKTAGKKKRKWPWVLGGFILLIVLIAALGGGGETGTAPAPTQADAPAPAAPAAPAPDASGGQAEEAPAASGVVYEVVGEGSANNITYGSNGGVSQENGESLPWTKTVPAEDGFGIYSLTAQNNGSGEITCRITVDGEQVAEQTSTGQYAVVSCTGNGSPF